MPLVIGISGLDSRKEDVMALGDAYLARGMALLELDMPGTGEAPVSLEPGAERIYTAVLDWVAGRDDIDATRVAIQGRSWSGYWAALLAVTEKSNDRRRTLDRIRSPGSRAGLQAEGSPHRRRDRP